MGITGSAIGVSREIYIAFKHLGKFKKNVTVQFFYPHALNMEYFYLNLSLKGVF